MPAILPRAQDESLSITSNTITNPVYIAGVCIIGIVALGLGVWLVRRYYQKRRAAKMDLGFLSVKGLFQEHPVAEKTSIDQTPAQRGAFSRNNLDPTIPMPEKTLQRPLGATRQEIIEYHRRSGLLPQSFSPKPFSFALSASSPSSPDSRPNSQIRLSVASFASGSPARYSIISTLSTTPSVQSTNGTARKVRQLFEPVLPDELLLTSIGEQLRIVQSFDDGWCVVGRKNGLVLQTAKSLFKSTPLPENDVELGVVPAWCFIKPMNGVRVERPVRSSSLGITVNMEGPSARDDLVSWSNF